MPQFAPMSVPPSSADTPTSASGLLLQLYTYATGPLHASFYQRHFQRFEVLGRTTPSWNSAAASCTLGWGLLRGLWRPTLLHAGLTLTLLALWLLGLHGRVPAPVEAALVLLGLLLLCLAPGFLGNAWYYQHIHRQTLAALEQSPTVGQAQARLQKLAASPKQQKLAATGQVAWWLLLAGLIWLGLAPSAPPPPRASVGPPVLHFPDSPAVAAAAASAVAAATATATAPGATAPAPADSTTGPTALPITPTPATTTAAPAATVSARESTVAPQPQPQPTAQAPAQPATAPAPTRAEQAQADKIQAQKAREQARAEARKTAREQARAEAREKAREKARAKAKAEQEKAEQAKAARARQAAARKNTVRSAPPPAPPSPKAEAQRYYVNAGTYANPDNAARAEASIRAARLPVAKYASTTNKGTMVRLRAGPFATEQQAQDAQRKLQAKGLPASVYRQR
ncbi:MAG: SPOR domain-containing protein [Comamonas sp.]|nr:SPOR domain-containing protein [Comamonas sp.]